MKARDPLSTTTTASTASAPGVWPVAAVLVLATIAIYVNTFSAPFVFDDLPAVRDNPTIRDLVAALSPPPGSGVPVSGRPLPNFSLAINYALGGTEVRSYHLTNLAIHVSAGLLLFGLARRTLLAPNLRERFASESTWLAGAIALLWLVHPLATAAVTYVVQRTESLMALFFLATLYAFARSETSAHGPTWRVVSVGACALGMACKEVMVAAPIVVMLYDRTFVSDGFRAAWRRHALYYLALGATWLLLGYLVISTGDRGGTAGFATEVSVGAYTTTQWVAIVRYLALALWPHPLVFDYGTALITNPWIVVPCALFVVALAASAVVALRRWPAIGFCGVSFFAILAPSSSFVPVATQTMAEHRMYLPLALVVALVSLGIFRWFGRYGLLALGLAASVLALATVSRNSDYRTNESLWRDTVAKRPDNPRALCSLADALFAADQADAALPFYEAAIRLKPDYAEAHVNLGSALLALGRATEAMPHLETAVRLQPALPKAHHNLANALARAGRADAAFAQYAATARLRPDDVTNLCDWANALQRAGRTADAIAHYEDAIRREPTFAMAHNNLANTLASTGRLPEAIAHYETALRLDPDYAEGHNNFATALAQSGRLPEAIQHFETAIRLRPDYPSAHENLGKVYLALGDHTAAQREFALARRAAPAR